MTAFLINGDLTAYGHPWQWLKYEGQFGRSSIGGVRMYPGLGNHDYQNNVRKENTSLNFCADLMLDVTPKSAPTLC